MPPLLCTMLIITLLALVDSACLIEGFFYTMRYMNPAYDRNSAADNKSLFEHPVEHAAEDLYWVWKYCHMFVPQISHRRWLSSYVITVS